MSLKQTSNPDLPVFDEPPQPSEKGFFIRRLMSLAGKPVLAEKNLPIMPSKDRFAKKCYANSSEQLYRQQKAASAEKRFRPAIDKGDSTPFVFSDKCDNPGIANKALSIRADMQSKAEYQIKSKFSASYKLTGSPFSATRFDSRNQAAGTYKFLVLAGKMSILGEKAFAGKLMYRSLPGDILQKAECDKFKPRASRQPDRFALPDQQLFFSARYLQTEQRFHSFHPIECEFLPYPGDYGFLNIVSSYRSVNKTSSFPDLFATAYRNKNDRFDSRSDYARNLVICCKTEFRPDPGINKAAHSAYIDLISTWSASLREPSLIPCSISHSIGPTAQENSRLNAQARICTFRKNGFPERLQLSDKVDKQKSFSANPRLKIVCSAARSRFRLKLTLRRADYAEPSLQPTQLLSRGHLATRMVLPETLNAAFRPLNTITKNTAIQHSALSDTSTSQHFCNRRSTMCFLSARHARYCRLAVKNCLTDVSKKKHGLCTTLSFKAPANGRQIERFFVTDILRPSPCAAIYLRPTPFLMKLSALSFTDIFLPEHSRRALPAKIVFRADFKQQMPGRRSALRSLRFRLRRINNGFKTSALKAARRILFAETVLRIKEARACPAMHETALCRLKATAKAFFPAYRGRLERFKTGECAPATITTQLPLKMPIMGQQTPEIIEQRNFINPPAWEFTKKTYRCRIRLSPYPFGFPTFNQPVERFQPIESAVSFAYLLLDRIRILIFDSYFPAREKVFLPPLSLRNPRRFLYPETGSLQKENYLEADNDQSGKIDKPEAIVTFSHNWGMQRYRTLNSNMAYNPLLARYRHKQHSGFNADRLESKHHFISLDEEIHDMCMPGIRRLLLRCARFFDMEHHCYELNLIKPESLNHFARIHFQQKISQYEKFACPSPRLHFYSPKAYRNTVDFPVQNKCAEQITYKIRYRTYSFPWKPETRLPELTVDYCAAEEPQLDRLTFFDQIGLNSCFMSFAQLTTSSQIALGERADSDYLRRYNSFLHSPTDSHKVSYQDRQIRLEQRLDYEKPGLPQQFDLKHFLRLVDIPRLKMRRFKHVRGQIKGYLASNMAKSATFKDQATMAFPARFDTGSIHWIILLRSFIKIDRVLPDFSCSVASTSIRAPKFSTIRAAVSTTFREKAHALEHDNTINEAPAIVEFRMPARCLPHLRMLTAERTLVASKGTAHAILHTIPASAPDSYHDADFNLNMSFQQRPQYRRNLQLFILHMAMNLDDYDLYLDVSEKSLTEDTLAIKPTRSEYRHPVIPEWLDLPQILEKRARMRI